MSLDKNEVCGLMINFSPRIYCQRPVFYSIEASHHEIWYVCYECGKNYPNEMHKTILNPKLECMQ